MDHFAAFYRTNSRMPGPLSRDSAYESVIPGVIAPPPASYTGEPTGEPTSGAATDYTLTGLEAMEKAGSSAVLMTGGRNGFLVTSLVVPAPSQASRLHRGLDRCLR